MTTTLEDQNSMTLTLEDQNLFNTIELSTFQTDEGMNAPHADSIFMLFTVINIVNMISRNNIHSLYCIDQYGRALNSYNHSLKLYFTSYLSIHDLCNSNYTCEHLDVFIEAYQVAVAPYIHPEDEYIFWKDKPNYKFDILNDGDGLIKGCKSAALLKNSLVYEICKRVDQPKFKIPQYERARKAKHQYERANKLVSSLRNSFSKLLVLRIDFCWSNQSTSSVDEMKTYFSKFMKRFHHDQNLPNIVGYLWKLEFGQKKGYHYHCIFFMDGNKFRSDLYYTELIGQYWSKLTSEKGFYYNCHRDKIKYRNLAIGLLNHDDETLFSNLNQVLLYICKQDQFVIDKRLKLSKCRVFQTSKISVKSSNLGRPRKFKEAIEPDTCMAKMEAKIIIRKGKNLPIKGDSK